MNGGGAGGKPVIVRRNGHEVTLDPEDAHLMEDARWSVITTNESGNGKNRYVAYFTQDYGTWHTTYLHRVVVNAQPGDRVYARDRNPLNCQKRNLRVVRAGPPAELQPALFEFEAGAE